MRSHIPLQNNPPNPATATFTPSVKAPTNATSTELGTGNLIGDYTILEHIATGGTANVYKVRDVRGDVCAIKLFREDRLQDTVWWMFQQEVERMQTLRHPNIVTLQAFGYHGRQPYLVLPYFPNSVSQRLQSGRLSVHEAIEIAIQVSSALAYIHSQDLIHGDVKPSNILLDEKGRVCLIDLGIMRPANLFGRLQRTDHFAGMVVGTIPYMKPEIFITENPVPSFSWDLYSFAVTFYEMLTGVRPPVSERPVEYHNRSREEAIPPVRNTDLTIPRRLDQIIQRCCAKFAGYNNAGQLYLALKQWKDRWRIRFAIGSIISVMCAAWIGVISMQPKEPPPPRESNPYVLTPEQQKGFAEVLSTRYTVNSSNKQKAPSVSKTP